MYIYIYYVSVYLYTYIQSFWNILQETLFCGTIEHLCKCDKLDAPWNTQWIHEMAFVCDQQEQLAFILSSTSWCPALLKSASNWEAGALNSCDTSQRMWTSSTERYCKRQNSPVLSSSRTTSTIIGTTTSTVTAATTTYPPTHLPTYPPTHLPTYLPTSLIK